jgi:ABC-type transport system involved in multi-copper enzyme maturation permease subunit
LLAGPIFNRQLLTTPKTYRHHLIRGGYVVALILLMYTIGQAAFGWQQVRNIGAMARFGNLVFQIFALVQLSLVLFFALLFTVGGVAQEKDRQTLLLLLMTDMRDRELVLGKLAAGLLLMAVLLAASVPVFVMIYLMGGVTLGQIGWTLALCASAGLAAGSWGSLVAFWREKTFQSLTIGVLGVVLFVGIAFAEAAIDYGGSESTIAAWTAWGNPYRALLNLLSPLQSHSGLEPVEVSAWGGVLTMVSLSVILNVITIFRLRAWNPSRFVYLTDSSTDDAATQHSKQRIRRIWEYPVIWREMRTRAYGRKVMLIKLAYLALAVFAAYSLSETSGEHEMLLGMISPTGFAFVGLSLIGLLLINTQAVTALTSERDGKTLELLLMTDVTAKEFIFSKLGGIFYNTKEVILIPLALIMYYVTQGRLSIEHMVYAVIGYLVLVGFATMLGLHSGLSFDNSRSAIANSLGTVFFLFIGIFIFMILLIEARGSFLLQFQNFVVFIVVGSLALSASLTHRNPSAALRLSAFLLPFLTFYSLTEFLLAGSLSVCLAISSAYGFTTLAMLVPAVSEFDVALGRTTLDKG